MELEQKIYSAAEYILSHTAHRPVIGMVLGSGLGDFADTLEDAQRIPYSEIPNFPCPTAPGHAGMLVFGKIRGKEVVIMQGRVHTYEGHSQQTVTMPIRVLSAMGVKQLILTNASGGINVNYHTGDLMLIRDHINFSFSNPLIGPNLDSFGDRFPDPCDLYTAALRSRIKEGAAQAGIPLQEGVYLMFVGPNYETPAESKMARILGADAVGMSTVPEALVANHCGMEVVGISCVSAMAYDVSGAQLTHEEVERAVGRAMERLRQLLELTVELL